MRRVEYKTKDGFGYVELPDDATVTKAPGLTQNAEEPPLADETLLPTGMDGGLNRPATDDEITALQDYADQNDILLPTALNVSHNKGKKAEADEEEILIPPQL